MDLRQAYKATIEALQRIEQLQAEEKQRLLEGAASLEHQRKELQIAIKQLEADQRAVQDVKDVKAQRELNTQNAKALQEKEVQLKLLENRLKKYENDLVGIKNRYDEADKALREREAAQAERERTYKEDLQKSFAENFAAKLLNK